MTRLAKSRSISERRGRTLRAKPASAMPIERATLPLPSGGGGAALPLDVSRQAQREMDRLRRLPAGSPEASQVRAYLQWLWSMPWGSLSSEDADIKEVEGVLERDHLGLTRAKERIVEYLAVRRLKTDLPGPTLCLVGPPGTGKTSLGASVARALRRPFARISVSGTSDAGELRGVSRTLPGAQPGKIVRALREAGARNPVLMIDGVDRLVGEGGLGVAEVLLELLDPEARAALHRSLSRPADRSVACDAAAVREQPRAGAGCAAGAHRSDRGAGLQRGREDRDRPPLPGAAPARKTTVSPRATSRSPRTRCAPWSATTRSKPACAGSPRQLATLCRKVARARATRRQAPPSHHCEAARALPRTSRVCARDGRQERRGRRRVGSRVDRGRRRGAGGRSAQDAGLGTRDDHRAARRGDEGIGAGGALVRALACRRARDRCRSVQPVRHPHPLPRRRRSQGRTVGRHHGRARDRVGAERPARFATTSR